jgi:hypothetical protein
MIDQVSPLGVDAAITIGKYQLTGQGQSGPLKVDGRWSEVDVREGGVWKIRLLTVTPKIEPKAVIPSAEANSTATSPESKSAGAGTASVVINIDKTNQKMTVFLDGVETYDWSVSTGKQVNSHGNLYCHLYERDLVQQTVGQRPHATFYFLYEGRTCHPWQQRREESR